MERGSPLLDAGDDPAETRLGQHDTRRGLCNVGRGRDGNAHLSLAQGRRIIGAVAAHPDRMSLLLEGLDQSKLLLWKNAGVDGEVLRPYGVGNVARRTYWSGEPDLARDRRRGGGRVARDHDREHAQRPQLGQQLRRVRARRIAERDEPDQFQRVARPRCHGSFDVLPA